jgi:hypothetical protein
MSRYEVRVAPRAQAQVDEVAAWWKINRQAAPMLVVDEFEAAAEELTIAPLSGDIYLVRLPSALCGVCFSRAFVTTSTTRSTRRIDWYESLRSGMRLGAGDHASDDCTTQTAPRRAPPRRKIVLVQLVNYAG